MITTGSCEIHDIRPIARDEVEALAASAYAQLIDLLVDLDDADWHLPTVCDEWSVQDMVGHLIGAMKSNISMREMARQQLHGLRHKGEYGGQPMDAANALQVHEHRHLSPRQRLDALRELAPRAAHERAVTPALLRRFPIPLDAGGSLPSRPTTRLTMGWLNEILYTRDTWLHRVDIARATDRDPEIDSRTDRRLLEHVVAEWATTHGEPVVLHLDGPAGGMWRQGTGGPDLHFSVADFLWSITGRKPAEGLLATWVLF